MERNEYLQLCKQNAIYPKSAKVKYNGCEYYPKSYTLAFDTDGNATHTACMVDAVQEKCEVWVELHKVK